MKSKVLLFFPILILILSACTNHQCVVFDNYNWCSESSSTIKVTQESVKVTNGKDGLPFEAYISKDCSEVKSLVNDFDQKMTIEKADGFSFEVFYTEKVNKLKLSSVPFLEGVAIGTNSKDSYCITWKGVNKKKALRLISLLISQQD